MSPPCSFRRVAAGVLCVLLGWGVGSTSAETLVGITRWSGQVRLDETVQVPSGTRLVIQKGTTVLPQSATAQIVVNGSLVIEGSQAEPVVFAAPKGWEGITFVKGEPGSRVQHARFTGAAVALSATATGFTVAQTEFRDCEIAIRLEREADPLIEGNRFVNNGIGIDNEMKSAPKISHNRFVGQRRAAILSAHAGRGEIVGNHFEGNQQGAVFMQQFAGRVADNVFIDNATGIYCSKTQESPRIEANRFEKNTVAIANNTHACPVIANNRFVNNGTAVNNDQFCAASVANNLFHGNRMALYSKRKSSPSVYRNLFEDNDVALYCDYSSYPAVKENNFVGNALGVKLGANQSADWEKRHGANSRIGREAARHGARLISPLNSTTVVSDAVDVSGNWWGKDTPQLAAAGERGNVVIFHDYFDQPEVSYEEYGPEKFRLDRVRFAPWLTEAVRNAGVGKDH